MPRDAASAYLCPMETLTDPDKTRRMHGPDKKRIPTTSHHRVGKRSACFLSVFLEVVIAMLQDPAGISDLQLIGQTVRD